MVVYVLAVVAAVLLHAGVLMALAYRTPEGAQSPGTGGYAVSLSSSAGAPAAAAPVQAPATVPEVEAAAEPTAKSAALATPPPAESASTSAADVDPVSAETVEATSPRTVAAATVPPENAAATVAARPAPPDAPESPPLPTLKPSPPTMPPETAAEAAAKGEETLADGGSGTASAEAGPGSDDRDARGGGAVGVPPDDYMARLRRWLERHKTYPENARRHRLQGTAALYVRVTRDGRVARYQIRSSSGHGLLDDAARAMIERASPLPAFPDEMTGAFLDVVVPVRFSLRGNS